MPTYPVMWLTFQSTLSVRRATVAMKQELHPVPISIHALRKESDLGFFLFIQWSKDFNPRSP